MMLKRSVKHPETVVSAASELFRRLAEESGLSIRRLL